MFLRIQPFVVWFTPLIWISYILLIDSIVYMLKKESLLMNQRLKFVQLMLVSTIIWYIFEIYNQFTSGWFYKNLPQSRLVIFTIGTLSFATILPAVFETFDLIRQFHFFNNLKIKLKIPTNKIFLESVILFGFVLLTIPFFWESPWDWLFIWTGFIFLLDPVLYIFHDEKSLIAQLKKKKFNTVFAIFFAGYVCGFLWEFWNYWAYTKWYYIASPILNNLKVFELPLFGFIAYGPFALELYVVYNFGHLLLSKKFLNRFGKIAK